MQYGAKKYGATKKWCKKIVQKKYGAKKIWCNKKKYGAPVRGNEEEMEVGITKSFSRLV